MHITNELRLGVELAQCLSSQTYRHPRQIGNGEHVLLIPGLGASDQSLMYLASWLSRSGFHPHKAGLIVNIGCSEKTMARLEQRVIDLSDEYGPIKIIGHSRGGLFAKALAIRHPDRVVGIATLGSPLVDSIRSVNMLLQLNLVGMTYLGGLLPKIMMSAGCATPDAFSIPGNNFIEQLLLNNMRHNYECAKEHCCESFWQTLQQPFPETCEFVSIHSRQDGIVAIASTLDPAAEHIEIGGSHVGMAWSTPVMTSLATWLDSTTATIA